MEERCADVIDFASNLEEMERRSGIIAASKALGTVLKPTGFCHYCRESEYVAPGALFCDDGCRDDWQRERDSARRNGE